MSEMSLIELESELAAELPARSMMSRRRMCYGYHPHSGASAHANNGSVANSNTTRQVIFNPQIAIVTGINSNGLGQTNAAPLIIQAGGNANGNTATQFGVPVNFQG